MPSISDTARTNLLAELGLTSSTLSNVDLMKLVRADVGQTTWTFTDASDAVNYWQYLESLRP
jgi:hypothetical protein